MGMSKEDAITLELKKKTKTISTFFFMSDFTYSKIYRLPVCLMKTKLVNLTRIKTAIDRKKVKEDLRRWRL